MAQVGKVILGGDGNEICREQAEPLRVALINPSEKSFVNRSMAVRSGGPMK